MGFDCRTSMANSRNAFSAFHAGSILETSLMPSESPSNVLAQLRQQARLSQRELAKRLQCSHSWICKREAVPSPEIRLGELAAYIAAVGIPLQVRFLGNGLMVSSLEEPTAGGGNGAHQTLTKPSPVLEKQIAELQSSNTTLKAAIAKSDVTIANLRAQLDASRNRNAELAATLEQNLGSYHLELAALQRQLEQRPEPSRELLAQLGQVQAEFKVAWGLMHQGQRLQVQDRLLSDEQRNQRAAMVHAGRSAPPLPVPGSLR